MSRPSNNRMNLAADNVLPLSLLPARSTSGHSLGCMLKLVGAQQAVVVRLVMRAVLVVAPLVVLLCACAAHGWETRFEETEGYEGLSAARDVAVAGDGNLVAVGGHYFLAFALSAETGAVLWRYDGDGDTYQVADGGAFGVAIDQAGDVVVAGQTSLGGLTVVKLADATGLEM
jgi:hypothetical protein